MEYIKIINNTHPYPTIKASGKGMTLSNRYRALYYIDDNGIFDIQNNQPFINGSNLKTINNESLIGSGNIDISGGGSSINVIDNLTSTSSIDALSANQGRILNNNISTINTQVNTNTSDIQGLKNDFNNEKHFLGWYNTNAEIEAITNAPNGSFAWSVESDTVWTFNGTTWIDSGISVPDQNLIASDDTPLIDGIASAGTSLQYSRSDHRHPSDTTKANISDLANYLELNGGTMTGTITTRNLVGFNSSYNIGTSSIPYTNGYFTNLYQANNKVIDVSTGIIYTTDSNGVPVLQLRPGTKIASASLADATSHEILGVNTYTDDLGEFDQLETGSKEALANVNIVYDANRTLGHMTADIYQEDGTYVGKEVFAYVSDITPKIISSVGTSTVVTGLPTRCIMQYVNYNRQLLFISDYAVDYDAGTVTITNPDITSNMTSTDKIEVMYYG